MERRKKNNTKLANKHNKEADGLILEAITQLIQFISREEKNKNGIKLFQMHYTIVNVIFI